MFLIEKILYQYFVVFFFAMLGTASLLKTFYMSLHATNIATSFLPDNLPELLKKYTFRPDVYILKEAATDGYHLINRDKTIHISTCSILNLSVNSVMIQSTYTNLVTFIIFHFHFFLYTYLI